MFWRFGGYANVSTLDTILDKPDLTVEELLEESDLIQELKQQNSKLIDYLRDENVIDRLLWYVLTPVPSSPLQDDNDNNNNDDEVIGGGDKTRSRAGSDVGTPKAGSGTTGTSSGSPSTTGSSTSASLDNFFSKRRKSRSKSFTKPENLEESPEEAQRKKYAFVACEILSSEVWAISDALIENPSSLRDFWGFLKRPPPLDPIQAGYFNKVNEALLDRKTEEMLDFIKSIDNVVSDLVVHVDCPPIMDLLLKMISLEKIEGGQGIVDWLQSRNLIPILLSYLSSEYSSATQTSAGDFLKAIITISANATTQDQSVIGPNELTRQLVSEPCIKNLIANMLRGGSPLTVGVGIIIEVIRKNNSDYDLESQIGPMPRTTDPIYLGTLLRQFANNVSNFMDLILASDRADPNDPNATKKRREVRVAFGEKIEPLGFDRFKTCELMAELLHCSNMALLNERGSEAEVRQRDEERERLKAEGKLTATAADDEDEDAAAIRQAAGDENELGTSVDSAGFHHARVPSSNLSGSPDEIRRLEVQNTTDEEDFEKVNAPLLESSSEKMRAGEREEELGEKKAEQDATVLKKADVDYESGVSGSQGVGGSSNTSKRASLGKTAEQSFLSSEAGITEMVDRLNLEAGGNNGSDMTTEAGENALSLNSPESNKTAIENQNQTLSTSPNTRISLLTQKIKGGEDHIEEKKSNISTSPLGGMGGEPESDRPAPLFQSKESRPRGSDSKDDGGDSNESGTDVSLDQKPPPYTSEVSDGEKTVAEGEVVSDMGERSQSVFLAAPQESEYGPALLYEVDIDGSPVVGDLLKMMFVEHRVVPTILDFFFRFPWNNFLHNVVYDVVQQVFNGQMERGFNRSLAIDLFETGRITERIIDGQANSDNSQAKTNMRLGYMGHLTLIAEEVVKFTERHPPELLSQMVVDKVLSQEWSDYVENTLAETRERDNAILGGVRPDMAGGPRQAVLNAVSGGEGGDNGSGDDGSPMGAGFVGVSAGTSGNVNISATDLIENNTGIGVDSMDLRGTTGSGMMSELGGDGAGDGSGAAYALAGGGGAAAAAAVGAGSLLSGFTNSSDEEDDELDELEGENRSMLSSGAAAAVGTEDRDNLPQADEFDESAENSHHLSQNDNNAPNTTASPNTNVIPSPLSLQSKTQQSQQSQQQPQSSTSPQVPSSSPSSSSSSSGSSSSPSTAAAAANATSKSPSSSSPSKPNNDPSRSSPGSGSDPSIVSASNTTTTTNPGATSTSVSSSSSIPPPLNIPPSRARRQFAARLAQRKKEAKEAKEAEKAEVEVGSGSGSGSKRSGPVTASGTAKSSSVGDRIRAIEAAGSTASKAGAKGAANSDKENAGTAGPRPRPRPKMGRMSSGIEGVDKVESGPGMPGARSASTSTSASGSRSLLAPTPVHASAAAPDTKAHSDVNTDTETRIFMSPRPMDEVDVDADAENSDDNGTTTTAAAAAAAAATAARHGDGGTDRLGSELLLSSEEEEDESEIDEDDENDDGDDDGDGDDNDATRKRK